MMNCAVCKSSLTKLTKRLFWCSACGSLQRYEKPVTIPTLVTRCRVIQENLREQWLGLWHVLEIDELIGREVKK